MSSPYRQAVLDRLSSPERLDETIRVVRRRWWVALTMTLFLIASTLAWGLLGSIDVRLRTTGVLVTPGAVTVALSPVSGYVVSVAEENVDISQGDVIARVMTQGADGEAAEVEVQASRAGRVFESDVSEGQFVRRGEPLSRIQSEEAALGRGLVAITYVSPAQAASLRRGMSVRITPVTVPSATFGFLTGTVESVGTFPESDSAILSIVGDSRLAEQAITGSEGVPIEVKVSLEQDASPSGYSWSSGAGPPFALSDGTLASIEVTTQTRTPLSFLTGS